MLEHLAQRGAEDDVSAVPVLAVDVVADHNKRFKPADGLTDARLKIIKIVLSLCLRQRFVRRLIVIDENVLVTHDNRVIADAAVPQTVKPLVLADVRGRTVRPVLAHVRNLYTVFLLSAVDVQNAAHKEDLVVRVRRQDQNVGLLQRGLPHLHIGGKLSRRVGVDLADIHIRIELNHNFLRSLRKFYVVVQETVLPVGLLVAAVNKAVGLHFRAPLNVNAGHLLLAGDGDGVAGFVGVAGAVSAVSKLFRSDLAALLDGDGKRSRIRLRALRGNVLPLSPRRKGSKQNRENHHNRPRSCKNSRVQPTQYSFFSEHKHVSLFLSEFRPRGIPCRLRAVPRFQWDSPSLKMLASVASAPGNTPFSASVSTF